MQLNPGRVVLDKGPLNVCVCVCVESWSIVVRNQFGKLKLQVEIIIVVGGLCWQMKSPRRRCSRPLPKMPLLLLLLLLLLRQSYSYHAAIWCLTMLLSQVNTRIYTKFDDFTLLSAGINACGARCGLLLHGTKVCQYSWHSAGSLGWLFPMLKCKYIFPIKSMEAILSNSTRKLLWFEIIKMLTAIINLLCYFL